MQGKGIIKFFLVLMALVCIWQFVLTIPSKRVEADAEDQALRLAEKGTAGYDSLVSNYLDSMSSEVVWSTPFKDYNYQELKNAQLAYGLDLVGGMSVVMQVDLSDYLKELAKSSGNLDPPFENALKDAKAAQANAQEDFITLFRRAFEAKNPNLSLASYFLNSGDDDNTLNIESSNDVVASWLRKKADATVKNTYELLRERIDKLGVVQPNVSLDAARDLIVVELPGIKNAKRARKFLEATAKLEFWHTYRNTDDNGKIINAFAKIDEKLQKEKGGEDATPDVPQTIDQIDTTYVLDDEGNSTGEVKSIDTTQVPNPEYAASQKAGPLFTLLTPNVPRTAKGSPILAFAKGNDRKRINDYLKREDIKSMLPRDLALMWGSSPEILKKDDGGKIEQYYLYGI
ncbi:MAG TPA: protein translocase subunit SecDF, partial [Phaeodactylibacter sp.]|nr:protein translocase subunit SecDF [Phaeodactylibacter sp.]